MMENYQLIDGRPDAIMRLSDNTFIPEGHPWYADYLAWVADGNTPEPADVPSPIPGEVTRYQARAALLGAGLLDKVSAYFAALPVTDLGRLAWDEAPTVLRSNAALETAAESLGLTSVQVDQLFIAASQVQ